MKSTNKTSAGLNIGSQQRQSIKSRADKVLGASGSLSTKSGKSTSAKVPPPMSSKTSNSMLSLKEKSKNIVKRSLILTLIQLGTSQKRPKKSLKWLSTKKPQKTFLKKMRG